jgi:hypothetical protein
MIKIYVATVLAAILLIYSIPWSNDRLVDNHGSRSTRQQPLINPEPITVPDNAVEISRGLDFNLPSDWIEEPPASNMRLAQFLIPSNDEVDAIELVVFNRIGGSLNQNLERWAGQFKAEIGGEKGELIQSRETVNGLNVTFASIHGTYSVSGPGMTFSGVEKPNYKMFAAIIESPTGNYYFKAVGPINAIDQRSDELKDFIRTVRIR